MQTSSNAVLTVLRVPPQFGVSGTNAGWSSNGFGMQLNGLSGHGVVVIYGSTNLSDWVPLLTNPPVIGTLPFMDSTATNLPSRFYKAEEQ